MDTNAIALGAEAQGPGSDATAACNSFAAQPPHQSHPHKPRLPPHGSDARRAYIASNKGMTRHGSYSGPAPFGGLRLSVSCTGEGPWSPPQHEAASPGASSVDFLDTPVDMSGLVRERTPKVGPAGWCRFSPATFSCRAQHPQLHPCPTVARQSFHILNFLSVNDLPRRGAAFSSHATAHATGQRAHLLPQVCRLHCKLLTMRTALAPLPRAYHQTDTHYRACAHAHAGRLGLHLLALLTTPLPTPLRPLSLSLLR